MGPSADTNSIGSERLRKAIERNREKNMRRELLERRKQAHVNKLPDPPSDSKATRLSVGKPEQVQFLDKLRSRPRAIKKSIVYEAKSLPVKTRSLESKKKLPVLLRWPLYALHLFFILRLVFADRGILDYVKRENTINERQQYMSSLKKENAQLIYEIEKIKSDTSYQKQLVREHLGFLAPEEHLVVFQDE